MGLHLKAHVPGADADSMRGVRTVTGTAATAVAVMLMTTPTATSAARTADEASSTTITVATYNVCKVNCSGRHPWAQRRKAVIRTVKAARPAVLAVQEAPTLRWRNTTQWADLSATSREAATDRPAIGTVAPKGCTRGAHLYFDPDRVRVFGVRRPRGYPRPHRDDEVLGGHPTFPAEPGAYFNDWFTYNCEDHLGYTPYVDMSAGMVSQRELSGLSWGWVQDRNVSWAYLQDIATGGVFIALSLHLPNEKTDQGENLRRGIAANVSRWIDDRTAASASARYR